MSGFQQHQFKTVDQPLNQQQRDYVDSLSSRARVTSTSATFVYHYGSFRGDEKKLMMEYFDAMLYVSNWGTKRLMFRFPRNLIDEKAIWKYAHSGKWNSYSLEFPKTKDYLILDFTCSEEGGGGGWIEEDDYELGDLLSLREQVLNGDYRMLYLAWLKIATEDSIEVEKEDYDEDEYGDEDEATSQTPPPIPPGLKKLSSALNSFADYFEIDEDLISAAAASASEQEEQKPNYPKLLEKLTQKEKEDYLLKLLAGEMRLDLKLKKHLNTFVKTKKGRVAASPDFKQLTEASIEHEKIRLAKEHKAAAKAHAKHMKEIEKDKAKLWKTVFENLERKIGSSYDKATVILKDLHDSAIFHNNKKGFTKKMEKVLAQFGSSKALMKRFEKNGLV